MAGFYAEVIKIANEANIKQLPSEQLAVALMTYRCPDENLKLELLKELLTMDLVFFDTAPSFETWETHRYLKNQLVIVRARGGGLLDHPYAPCYPPLRKSIW